MLFPLFHHIKFLYFGIIIVNVLLYVVHNNNQGDIMKIKEFIGSTVLDKSANVVGKVDNIDFNVETGKIETIVLTLQKNIFSRDELEISFDDIATIGAYVILNKEIPKEAEEAEKEVETVEAEIVDDAEEAEEEAEAAEEEAEEVKIE